MTSFVDTLVAILSQTNWVNFFIFLFIFSGSVLLLITELRIQRSRIISKNRMLMKIADVQERIYGSYELESSDLRGFSFFMFAGLTLSGNILFLISSFINVEVQSQNSLIGDLILIILVIVPAIFLPLSLREMHEEVIDTTLEKRRDSISSTKEMRVSYYISLDKVPLWSPYIILLILPHLVMRSKIDDYRTAFWQAAVIPLTKVDVLKIFAAYLGIFAMGALIFVYEMQLVDWFLFPSLFVSVLLVSLVLYYMSNVPRREIAR